ncbi:MAG: putative toxin-antitoxin system toxin component, PIN family [Candidatus Celaenobacter polaris]|nr:putative toxin-antitoxin system toxin component, PIN family [Candidatus Celaenobacter polaris]
MRVFLDSNVLISAVASRGLCADVMREVLTSHELVVCEPLISELTRNLKSKIRLSDEMIEEFVSFLQKDSIKVNPEKVITINGIDENDRKIITCAIHRNAEVFVTGDKELLDLHKIEKLTIISPREFWERSKG